MLLKNAYKILHESIIRNPNYYTDNLLELHILRPDQAKPPQGGYEETEK